jgi:putative cardiolipin synthase
VDELVDKISNTSVLGTDSHFIGSPLAEVGKSGLFPVRGPENCNVLVLQNGEDSLAVRLSILKHAKKSIRIQALIFKGDESGIRIAEILKQKKAEGLDVRVIVDAFSNPWLQTQWLFFDLKQHGIEVEGYEAIALQWLNEVPLPIFKPHIGAGHPDMRYHEKMWIIDGEMDDGIAVTGGLNIGNEYFRANPNNPDFTWRDQDIVVRGSVTKDLAKAFDRNFDHFLDIKNSRGIFNTNLYWEGTRKILDETGKVPVVYNTDPVIVSTVKEIEARPTELRFNKATCRFIQNRPRLRETYIQQAYIKLIEQAEHEVLIANAYFVPTPTIRRVIKSAAKRCVSVKLISNSPETNDLLEVSLVGRGYYSELLSVNESADVQACNNPNAGIRIWEWIGQSADEETRNQGTMHSKYAVVDGLRSLVGSYNLDPRSERLNSESAIVFEQSLQSYKLRNLFHDNDLYYSREVTSKMAAEFESPEDVVLRFHESLGEWFENEL